MKSDHEDPLVKDRKELPLTGWSALPPFLASVFVAIPFYFVVLLPLTALWTYACRVCRLCCGYVSPQTEEDQEAVTADPTAPSLNERRYDLVVFGATGFTGKLAATYLAKQYGNGAKSRFRWAIAGRRVDALEKLRSELIKLSPSLKDLGILIADSGDFASVLAMVRQAKVVITTAGPFARYGTPLVKACAMTGTSYCDITGECDWVRKNVDQFDDLARKTGARIVSFCGHDCVPWEMCVLAIAKTFQQRGESLKEIVCYDEVKGEYSGGTMETMASIITAKERYTSKLGFDPLIKTTQGQPSTFQLVDRSTTSVTFSNEISRWTGSFIMTPIMADCIRRSNAINQYGPQVSYKEAVVHAGFMAGVVGAVKLTLLSGCLMFPSTNFLLRKLYLPKPGQGPSEKAMDDSFLKVTAIGTSDQGSKVQATIYFSCDAAYKDTARMLVESGLSLVLPEEKGKIKVGGGVWTPASCQGEVLLRRLEATGTYFQLTTLELART